MLRLKKSPLFELRKILVNKIIINSKSNEYKPH
jgi:hypothetical protein